jgi:integrase
MDTKTDEARSIPIGRELREVFERLPVALDAEGKRIPYVFTHNGRPVKSIKRVFARVRQQTGITNTVFHDYRHTATTNLRRAGVDALTAMKITGHKTMAVFKRYNTIDEQDLKAAQRRTAILILSFWGSRVASLQLWMLRCQTFPRKRRKVDD